MLRDKPREAGRRSERGPGDETRASDRAAAITAGTEAFLKANFVGTSGPFVRALDIIKRVGCCNATVLIQGETGTGKELAARAIHYFGVGERHPFVPINCGAMPEGLIESELFGHVRGAFTDAKGPQAGLVSSAEGGTLFLDEVECLSSRGQVALLRLLQSRTYRQVGGQTEIPANVRIIAATNRALAEMVQSGEFRQDLFYRLAILLLEMPPLRERGRDVVVLARHFLRVLATQYGVKEAVLDEASEASLLAHDWPGNVRELENLLHREFLMAENGVLRIRIGASSRPPVPCDRDSLQPAQERSVCLGLSQSKAIALAQFERSYLTRVMEDAAGNVSLAARMAAKERRAFGRLLKKYGIDRHTYSGGG